MVKLSLELIARATSGYTKKKKDETLPQFVGRLTHIYLENKNIDDVGDCLSLCRNLTVLYLYDNHLNNIPCLANSSGLTHLYLQNNNISIIEHLSSLQHLQKLFIGGNTITVVEGLEKLDKLQELHIENQRLPIGEQLLFDPRTLQALGTNLQVLNVSGNHLTSLSDLKQLPNLTHLMAAENELNDMKELTQLLVLWTFLTKLDLSGNPLCQRTKYKDRVIVLGKNLEMLDGKSITDTARQFLVNWQANRDENRKKLEEIRIREDSFASFPNTYTGTELPPLKSIPTRLKGVGGYIMPGMQRRQFDEILAKSSVTDNDKQRNGILRAKFGRGRILRMGVPESAPLYRLPRPLSVESIHLSHSARRHKT
ncbi:protein phosphatase 1 regulatory subunit 42 isoform X1 [Biomphalaria glabrata]|nr:protein phosphatase 1 regulatory subunit 42 isoform X1 [Biomphalaria glabrata]